MCRNIRTLYNYDPPASAEEIREAALQYVRKVSGFRTPSAANEVVFADAVHEIEESTARLLESLVTRAPARNREVEATKARERSAQRFGDRTRTPG